MRSQTRSQSDRSHTRPYEKFEGVWRSRYAKAGDLSHGEVIDDMDVETVRDGIVIKSKPTPDAESYSARGRVYKNQVMGTWQHTSVESYAEGLFMLAVNPLANVIYGYCTGCDESGAMIFETWEGAYFFLSSVHGLIPSLAPCPCPRVPRL
jgi:hypothetical protein